MLDLYKQHDIAHYAHYGHEEVAQAQGYIQREGEGRGARGVRGIKRQEVVGAGVEVRVQDLDDGLHRICRNR